VEKTVIDRLRRTFSAFLAITVGACGGDGTTPNSSGRIDYVAGAIEPIVARGEPIVIEGFGFGPTPGKVRFPRSGGGVIDVAVADSDWSIFAIVTSAPDSAATGRTTLTVLPAGGGSLAAVIHLLPRPSFNPSTLTWNARTTYPGAPAGIALAAAQFPDAAGLPTTLYAAGGAEPSTGPSGIQMTPDSGVYVAHTILGGAGSIGNWARQRDVTDATRSRVLPAPRAFAAIAVATRYNSRFPGSALYVIGGIDAAGRAQGSVFSASVTADSVTGPFALLEALPSPVAGAIAVVRQGRIYVLGGTDTAGRAQSTAYVGRIGPDGHIDGWYTEPPLPGPRAYGAGVVREGRVFAIGGVQDSVPPGGGVDAGTPRLVTGDTATVSQLSGFFIGSWGSGPALLPEGRSQFALLALGNTALAVGGMYASAPSNAGETLAATVAGDSVGAFGGPVGTNRIADQTCLTQPAGTLIGPAGAAWREADGTSHGLVVGGLDLNTLTRRSCVWGF
jgi:hypothetical protein